MPQRSIIPPSQSLRTTQRLFLLNFAPAAGSAIHCVSAHAPVYHENAINRPRCNELQTVVEEDSNPPQQRQNSLFVLLEF
jgi:hypothetical protein